MSQRRIEPLHPDEVDEAAFLQSRAYSSVPLITAVFGAPSEKQRSLLENGFKMTLGKMPGEVFTAKEDDSIVGVMRIVEWPDCQKSALQGFYFLPALLILRGKALRMRKWNSIWGKHDPGKPHWHLSSVCVLPEKQGQGIGSRLIRPVLARADTTGTPCYLETQTEANVAFYRRRGFEVMRATPVLDSGLTVWTMLREPGT